jgi:hypothetical protein
MPVAMVQEHLDGSSFTPFQPMSSDSLGVRYKRCAQSRNRSAPVPALTARARRLFRSPTAVAGVAATASGVRGRRRNAPPDAATTDNAAPPLDEEVTDAR